VSKPALVVIVDDDESVRESLPDLLVQLEYTARAFASAAELLASDAVSSADCLILDVGLPGMSGPELWRELIHRGYRIPTVFITGRSTPPGALRESGVACLLKPFSDDELKAALDTALQSGNY
jgi:FixJ family two-component response regulator